MMRRFNRRGALLTTSLGAVGIAVVAAFGGCSSSAPVSATTIAIPGPTVTVTATPSSTTASTNNTAVASGEPIGKTQTFKAAEVTVLEVKDKIQAHSDFGPDQRWFGALAKICFTSGLGPEGSTLTWNPWSVIGSDGGTYPASTSYWEDFPTPKYPSAGEVFKAGECAQGWILFAVKSAVTAKVVRYSNQSGNIGRWNV